jgi:hypothetical protein
VRAGVWQVIEMRAKELKDQAKAELQALEVGDTVSGRHDGQVIAKATKTRGRVKIVVRNERQFLEWVRRHHETEIVESVNPPFMNTLKVVDGVIIDAQGEPVTGCGVVEGEPYVSVRREKDAAALVAQLLSSGRLSLDGVKALEAS